MIEQQAERRRNRVEDIEFMLDMQTPYHDIVVRSGYSTEAEMLAGLKRAGRMDLRLRYKKRKNVLHVNTNTNTYGNIVVG